MLDLGLKEPVLVVVDVPCQACLALVHNIRQGIQENLTVAERVGAEWLLLFRPVVRCTEPDFLHMRPEDACQEVAIADSEWHLLAVESIVYGVKT